ncbi:MAG: Lrp/AsnC family transcriptional regulator [Nitrososphaerales archaeon]
MKRDQNGYHLDDKDRLLLSILQENAEISFSELGKKVNLTKMAISNRIKRLKDAGIIEGSYFKVNPEKMGLDYTVISRVICSHKGLEQEKIANAIAKFPGVMSVYLVFGTSDMLVIARRKDKTSAKQLVYDISRIPGVRNTNTTIPHTVIKESLALDTMMK